MESQTTELKNWCCGEVLAEAHALMVLIPEDVDITKIEDTLQTKENVPLEVLPPDGKEAWPIVIVGEAPPAPVDDFNEKLAGLLLAEGKTGDDLQSIFSIPDSPTSPTESILRALSELLDKTKPPSEHGDYRRLRLLSRTLPTPAGEEQFEHWLEQARPIVEESACSLKEKRGRLMERLKGSAQGIVKSAQASNPDVSPEQCLEALEHAFGTAESEDDLSFAFRLMQQQSGEKLSDFLRRLEQSLDKVVQ
ncbi:paraneoplastic antigen Ma1 homolog [Lampris incognitus]|uniref:paraneoplastic antigen Ma1 homolog n=1 Tax=Lampris incognitus TaxID=2546036 RepID=UPI0024B58BFD|nr:paraneoplastic antigen Ma1 homolog [Lampris incognitus]